MTSDFPIGWATLAVSIVNTILLLWLGLTVILNSERRSLGVWLAGAGLMLSSLFFLSHTAILGLGPLQPGSRMNLWWRTGWIPVVSMPFAWYLVMLWYSSYWDDPHSPIHQRHQIPIILATLLSLSTVGLVLLFNALPSYSQLIQLDLGGVLSLGGIPVLMIVYPFYLLICIGFSLDVLLHPGAPGRLMGQIARQRARPWLLVATTSLLLVSLLVGVIIIWGISIASQSINSSQFAQIISTFDLLIDFLIAVTILSVGQAIVSYEIFTGKVLPRQSLKRYWKLAIILSLIFGIFASWALYYHLEPVYLLLLSIILITGFYAVLGWRSFTEKEYYINTLRPFITSQHLYDQFLLHNTTSIDFDITRPFHILCRDILGAKQAFLIPMGIFGPLAGGAISYPEDIKTEKNEELLVEIRRSLSVTSRFAPEIIPDSAYFGRNSIAVPLWSVRGLVGTLILGEKNNDSLYTQEDIEIARTISERLIDSKASNELAHKLMDLQRQRLSETKLIDQQTRRSLHDDILPKLQSTMIELASKSINTDDAIHEMSEIHHQLTAILRELPTIYVPELAREGLIETLQVTIDNEYRPFFNSLSWQIDEKVFSPIKSIPSYALDVIYHATREAVRNAARHGRQSETDPPINLHIAISWNDGLIIRIQDDGVGFDPTLKNDGNNGQGLTLHSTLMAVVGGSLAVESIPDKCTYVTLKYPT